MGRLIAYERKKKKISLEKLSKGVLTHTGLKRLEDAEKRADLFCKVCWVLGTHYVRKGRLQ